MRLEYDLTARDYADWVAWNVRRRERKRILHGLFAVYLALALLLFIAALMTGGRENLVPVLLLIAFAGAALLRGISDPQQFRFLWKKSGAQWMQEKNRFPHVTAVFDEEGFALSSPEKHFNRRYAYTEVRSVQLTERLILLETPGNAYQMIARSAFAESGKSSGTAVETKAEAGAMAGTEAETTIGAISVEAFGSFLNERLPEDVSFRTRTEEK